MTHSSSFSTLMYSFSRLLTPSSRTWGRGRTWPTPCRRRRRRRRPPRAPSKRMQCRASRNSRRQLKRKRRGYKHTMIIRINFGCTNLYFCWVFLTISEKFYIHDMNKVRLMLVIDVLYVCAPLFTTLPPCRSRSSAPRRSGVVWSASAWSWSDARPS